MARKRKLRARYKAGFKAGVDGLALGQLEQGSNWEPDEHVYFEEGWHIGSSDPLCDVEFAFDNWYSC